MNEARARKLGFVHIKAAEDKSHSTISATLALFSRAA